jgi:C1A family cysteine protease
MKFALSTGPVSVAVDASQSAFQQYKSGVLSSYECGTSLDHGIMAVGWGTDSETGGEYFLVKNQWGSSWGDNGYLKIGATSSNPCGILSEASFVTV